jgi:hypothetical protein
MKDKMHSGVYVGKVAHLRGERALVRFSDKPGQVMAQFDNPVSFSEANPYFDLAGTLNYGWHAFPASDFDIDIEVEWR